MLTRKQEQAVQNLQQIWQLSKTNSKQQMQWLLRGLLVMGKQQGLSGAGFVLPTVAMVSLVVVLLTTAMMIRAFDQSKYASNVRVNAAVLNAATPAIDRARAKIEALLGDPALPRATPSDRNLYDAFTNVRYSLGDETRLKLVRDINADNTIQTGSDLVNNETLNTAWKFPVDTDNNGKFDSYTLYSIHFRSPSRATDGKFNRARNPLEARTPPMNGGTTNSQCPNESGTSANIVGDSDWYKSGAKLTKSFFVYTATVPITILPPSPTVGAADDAQVRIVYEVYKGNKGFSALEFQQDRSRIPLSNNAALFQDDLELTPGGAFRMNGKIFTNGNLLVGGHGSGGLISFYQVSSKNSCFYKEENSKINVGGNVGTGNVADPTDQTAVTVHLFKGVGIDPGTATINGSNRSTSSPGGSVVGYNDAAYNNRIALMKQTALFYSATIPPTVTSVDAVTQYPPEVKDGFKAKVTAPGGNSLIAQDVLADQLELYLKNRTRRVPYAEVAFGGNAIGATVLDFSTTVEPPATWREPTNANTGLTLTTTNLAQTQPEKQREDGVETSLGDRVNVGNNLPAYWKKDGKYVTGPLEKQLLGSGINWTTPNTQERYRTTEVIALPDVGISNRDGFWEDAAAQQPSGGANSGGLRVITGAGIYRNSVSTYGTTLSSASFASPTALDTGGVFPNAPLLAGETTATQYKPVWSDSMPMKGGGNEPPDLRMRATVVYHYKDNAGTSQTPIACVSSYYDPTNVDTAKNKVVDGGYGIDATNGRSNNGVVYAAPYTTNTARFAAIRDTYLAELKAQAKLMFPNGRIVNEPLQNALKKLNTSGALADNNKPLSLSENSAIDSAICAIKILTDITFIPVISSPVLPHGAIKEASFLDARQVKAIDKTASNYDLELEQRQPLEVRVTDIDINLIRLKTIGSATQQEYILPNSGIIYASRDDALLDLSNTTAQKELLSPTDFILDPTRRPNGIRLFNGSNLERDDDFRVEEKGLILVTNLPSYIKGDFNQHYKSGTTTLTEEFNEALLSNWSNFYSRAIAPNTNFACRKGQTGCGSEGDQWRPATIISDAITLLSGGSNGFKDGFRNQGDYDLRNNAGISATEARKKNGFFDNSFVTSALWWLTTNTDDAYPEEKTTDSYVSSYLMNAVTPVQRRVDSREYLMEYCPKIPVSLCTKSDWVVNSTTTATAAINAPFVPGTHKAGTTAKGADSSIDSRFARRVAFQRKANFTLELTDVSGEATPIPLGIDGSGVIKPFPYSTSATPTLPREVDNALWFRTTTNIVGKPYNNPSYENDRSLAYTGDTKLISPPTPDITGVDSLNLPANNPASGYTICTKNEGSTKEPTITGSTTLKGGNCASETGNPLAAIEATYDDLVALNPASSGTDEIFAPTTVGTLAAGTTTTYTQTGRVNVIDLVRSIGTSDTASTVIKLVGNADSVFVFRKTGGSLDFADNSACKSPCSRRGVVVELDGVDPNNIFWTLNSAPQWNEVSTSYPHEMKGTFISKGTAAPSLMNVNLEGRLLGFNGLPGAGKFTGSKISAIASSGQPFLVPVLQIHSPEGTPDNGTLALPTDGTLETEWLQQAAPANTTINAVFVTGNSPSRTTEESAGLHNFVRFIERWSDTTLNIKGSFLQFKRSAYATAPFSTVLAAKSGANDGSLSIFGYSPTRYKTGNGTPEGTLPFYGAPSRQWGFDVGILAQSPDLFSQRFTILPVAPPDEFFREVGRDDEWVQNLLCAAQGSGTSYSYVVDSNRPSNCKAIASYND